MYVNLQNFLFGYDSLKGNLPSSLTGKLSLVDIIHNTRNEYTFQLNRPYSKTIVYGSRSIKSRSVDMWNFINEHSQKEKADHVANFLSKKFLSTDINYQVIFY